MPLSGGYCASMCGLTGAPCDGACVETPRAGELCLAACTSDAQCRTNEGYVCDPQWKACVLPNMTTIVPKACPAPSGIGRHPAFGPSVALSTAAAPGVYQFEPSGVVTPDGSFTAMYITRAGLRDPNVLGIGRVDAAGRVTADVPFTSGRANHFDPWLAHDGKGTIYAAWLGFDRQDLNQEIGFARSTDGGVTWSKPIAAHAPSDCPEGTADCIDKPMVAAGGGVVYVMYAAEGLRVRASRDGGKTFGAPRTALDGIYASSVVGGDGRLHIVSLNGGPRGAFGSADHVVEYTVSSDRGQTFSPPIAVSVVDETLPFFFSNPSIAVDDRRGWLYVVYTRGGRDAKWDLVVAASKDGGKTWKRTRIGDDPPCAIHMVPNVALDPVTGRLHIAWYDSRGDNGRFAHADCTIGAATCTQRGRINDVPFAGLSTVRHGARWIGEYQSLVVDAKRRVLHAAWSQPVAEGDKVITRVFHAKAKLPPK